VQVATTPTDEPAAPDVGVLLARGEGRRVGAAITLALRPAPAGSGQGCAGLPSPYSQSSQISPKFLSGAFFST
jgi:hypothetical protein